MEASSGADGSRGGGGSPALEDDAAAAWLSSSSSSSSSSSDGSDEAGAGDADDDTAALLRSMEAMLADTAPTPLETPASLAAAPRPDECAVQRDWRDEWRRSATTVDSTATGSGLCTRSAMPVAEAQRSRVVEIPGLLDPHDIEQIHALARLRVEADPFWDP
jgi:hypothetical protein